MIALALALVACCAMVCGTRLMLRGYDVREVEAEAAIRDVATVDRKVDGLNAWAKASEEREKTLRAEVDSLRAALALRQV